MGNFLAKPGYVYFARTFDFVKIGASKNPEKRINTFKIGNPEIALMKKVRTIDMEYLEHECQEFWRPVHRRGEWFRLSGELKSWIEELPEEWVRSDRFGRDALIKAAVSRAPFLS